MTSMYCPQQSSLDFVGQPSPQGTQQGSGTTNYYYYHNQSTLVPPHESHSDINSHFPVTLDSHVSAPVVSVAARHPPTLSQPHKSRRRHSTVDYPRHWTCIFFCHARPTTRGILRLREGRRDTQTLPRTRASRVKVSSVATQTLDLDPTSSFHFKFEISIYAAALQK